MIELDHFAWACSSLDAGMAEFERLSGVSATVGGSHEAQGTRNALASLGDGLYLAIDAPDPAQSLQGTYGASLAAMNGFDLNVFACRVDDILRVRDRLEEIGYETRIFSTKRTKPDGYLVLSRGIAVEKQLFGKGFPLLMQWDSERHPSESSPKGCTFWKFGVLHPQAEQLQKLYDYLGLKVNVEHGEAPMLHLTLDGANGRFLLPTQ